MQGFRTLSKEIVAPQICPLGNILILYGNHSHTLLLNDVWFLGDQAYGSLVSPIFESTPPELSLRSYGAAIVNRVYNLGRRLIELQ